MHKQEPGYWSGAAPIGLSNTRIRARITRPLSSDELAAALPKGPGGGVNPHPPTPDAGGVEASRITRQFKTDDLHTASDVQPQLRPVLISIEPSYMPLAPGRPDTLEVLLPAGIIQVRPWRGEGRQVDLPRPTALRLHQLALQAMSVPTTGPPSGTLDVIPMVVIMRYEGFAHRWTMVGPGRTALDELIATLTALAGYDLGYGG